MMLATGAPYSDSDDLGLVKPSLKQLSPPSDKRRKLSHAKRKEKLEEEIRILQSGVAVMQTRGLEPPLSVLTDPILLPLVQENTVLRYAIETQQLRAAKMQSALSQCMGDQELHPLYCRITLGNDGDERRSTLLSLRQETLRNALEFVRALAPTQNVFSEHRFETGDGDLCCIRVETTHFPGVASLEQVFDAVAFYKNNMEFIISEQLGHVTLRDDYDDIDHQTFNTRILSTNESGITTEGNVVSFRHLFRDGDDGYEGEPCAVMTVNSVDEDKQYPYFSSQRVRKDVCGAVVLTASNKTEGKTDPLADMANDVVVTMRRVSFMKLRHPEFPLSENAHDELRDGMSQWCDLMLKTVRGIVYSKSS